MRIVSLLPSTTEILFAIGAGDDVVGRDVRVRPPGRGPHAGRSCRPRRCPRDWPRPRSTRTSPGAMRRGEDLYHLDAGRAVRPRRRPGRHPGPVRGLRGRRLGRRRRARPPRLHGGGADDRPAHPRRGAGVHRDARQGDRPRGRGGALVADQRQRLDAVRAAGRRAAPAAGDAAGVDRPAVRPRPLGAGDDRGRGRRAAARAPPARSPSGSPGRRSRRRDPRSSWSRRAASTAPAPRRSPTSWSRSGRLPAGVPVHPVDANAAWARPGTRLVDGVEELPCSTRRRRRVSPRTSLARPWAHAGRRSADPEPPAAAEPVAEVLAVRRRPGPGAEVGPDDGGAEVVELGRDHPAVDPAAPSTR